mmetsp:Transcript_75389/g.149638  ORF Transcript_75389/g.149638 Transcript_75389/m.149638 type:complete len:202 (+) Transcript_75389:337-942(+)
MAFRWCCSRAYVRTALVTRSVSVAAAEGAAAAAEEAGTEEAGSEEAGAVVMGAVGASVEAVAAMGAAGLISASSVTESGAFVGVALSAPATTPAEELCTPPATGGNLFSAAPPRLCVPSLCSLASAPLSLTALHSLCVAPSHAPLRCSPSTSIPPRTASSLTIASPSTAIASPACPPGGGGAASRGGTAGGGGGARAGDGA